MSSCISYANINQRDDAISTLSSNTKCHDKYNKLKLFFDNDNKIDIREREILFL